MARNILEAPLPLLFPQGFLWGSATAAHQVEGGKNKPGFSNWGSWETSPARLDHLRQAGRIQGDDAALFVSGDACNFRRKYPQDFRMARAFAHNAIRFSIDWAEVEPQDGRFDRRQLQRARNMVQAALTNGLTPVVTLYHWTHPGWFEQSGGWTRPDAPALFERMGAAVLEEIGSQVTWWTVLNEPNVYSSFGFAWGLWPPQVSDPTAAARVVDHQVEAHTRLHRAIKAINPQAKVGIAQSCAWNEADDPAKKAEMDQWNFAFVDRIRDRLDFVGVNVYHHNAVTVDRVLNGWAGGDACTEAPVLSDFNWGMCPRSLAEVCREFAGRYGLPVMVTEHGHAVREIEDRRRCWFLWESLKWLHQAIADGTDIPGYLHWSLLDNFEWADGYEQCFGLWHIERNPAGAYLARTPRRSAYLFRDIIKAGGLTVEIADRYADVIGAPSA